MSSIKKTINFMIFGQGLQGAFCKHTKLQADKLGIYGWCKKTSTGQVIGIIEGPLDKLELMMHWLQTKGSPRSKIEKALFDNQRDIDYYTQDDFIIID